MGNVGHVADGIIRRFQGSRYLMIARDTSREYIVPKVTTSDNILYGKLGLFGDMYDILGRRL